MDGDWGRRLGGVGWGFDLGRRLGGDEWGWGDLGSRWGSRLARWGWGGLFSIEMRTDVKSQHLSLSLWPGSVFYWCLCKLRQAFVVTCQDLPAVAHCSSCS